MRFTELEAVTVDGYGTLLRLHDPVPTLRASLGAHGIERTEAEIGEAFLAEVGHYRPRSHLAHDTESLASLRLDCVRVFLEALGEPLPPGDFVDAFIASLVFQPIAGAIETLDLLRGQGLRLAVVANWDCALEEQLDRTNLARFFDVVVTSAGAGVAKPDPGIFELALGRLGVPPSRALHVGDEPVDEEGARAAGLAFAHAPLATAFEGWE